MKNIFENSFTEAVMMNLIGELDNVDEGVIDTLKNTFTDTDGLLFYISDKNMHNKTVKPETIKKGGGSKGVLLSKTIYHGLSDFWIHSVNRVQKALDLFVHIPIDVEKSETDNLKGFAKIRGMKCINRPVKMRCIGEVTVSQMIYYTIDPTTGMMQQQVIYRWIWKENNKLDPIVYDFKAAANKPNVR